MDNNNNALLIAGAIIAAGALIAVGIYLAPTNTGQQANNGSTNNNGELERTTINNAAVSEDDFIRGSSTAAVTVIDYSDLECPFCKQFHQIMKRLNDKYSGEELAWVYRHFPLEQLHSKAPAEAHATECAAELGGQQAFWDYTDRIFEVTPSNNGLDLDRLPEIAEEIGLDRQAFAECQESDRHKPKVDADLQDARNAGGRGTPFVVVSLAEEPSEEVKSELENMVRQVNSQSRRDRMQINENSTKIASSGALPFQALDRLIQLVVGEESDTETAATNTAAQQ